MRSFVIQQTVMWDKCDAAILKATYKSWAQQIIGFLKPRVPPLLGAEERDTLTATGVTKVSSTLFLLLTMMVFWRVLNVVTNVSKFNERPPIIVKNRESG